MRRAARTARRGDVYRSLDRIDLRVHRDASRRGGDAPAAALTPAKIGPTSQQLLLKLGG
jgi:hypothetical protein